MLIERTKPRLLRRRLEANFKCRSRRFLNFQDCCEWVQKNHDFNMGEGLSFYVPTRPDEVYSRTGHWRDWHFFFRALLMQMMTLGGAKAKGVSSLGDVFRFVGV